MDVLEHEPFLRNEEGVSSRDPKPDVLFFCLLFLLKFFVRFTATLLELPVLLLIEQKTCRAYSGTSAFISELDCKSPTVQIRFARIAGYKSAFDALACTYLAPHVSRMRLGVDNPCRSLYCTALWLPFRNLWEKSCYDDVNYGAAIVFGLDRGDM
jgi:hypothetical protein